MSFSRKLSNSYWPQRFAWYLANLQMDQWMNEWMDVNAEHSESPSLAGDLVLRDLPALHFVGSHGWMCVFGGVPSEGQLWPSEKLLQGLRQWPGLCAAPYPSMHDARISDTHSVPGPSHPTPSPNHKSETRKLTPFSLPLLALFSHKIIVVRNGWMGYFPDKRI